MKNRRNFFDRFVKTERTGRFCCQSGEKVVNWSRPELFFGGTPMEPVLFAAGCFTAAVALAAGIYASFTARGKGPVLSNSYWFSVLKRENANKKAEYRLVTVVFSCLSAIFLLLTVEIFTQWPWTAALRWALIAFVLIYALADAFRTVLKGSKT